MPSSLAAARIAAPASGGKRSNVRQEPSDMAETVMLDVPSGRGRRLFAGIGQPPFGVPAALMARRPDLRHRCRYWSASLAGAQASQPSVIASRSAEADAFRNWMSTAA